MSRMSSRSAKVALWMYVAVCLLMLVWGGWMAFDRAIGESVVPAHDPETCVDLAWLEARWTCIPREEAG